MTVDTITSEEAPEETSEEGDSPLNQFKSLSTRYEQPVTSKLGKTYAPSPNLAGAVTMTSPNNNV